MLALKHRWQEKNWYFSQQRSCYSLLNHQSYSNPLEKDLFKQPPTPSEIASFLTSSPPFGVSVPLRGGGGGGGGMDIFTTPYTYQREAVEGKKSFKIL